MAELTENAKKYKSLGKAVLAGDVEASREIFEIYKENNNVKTLDDEQVFKLATSWISAKCEKTFEMAEFLKELGFDFNVHTVAKDENSGTKLPFRLISSDSHHSLLVSLIKNDYIPIDLMDGNGDTLLTNAVLDSKFELAEQLIQMGANINETNIAGETALHICAGKVKYEAVEWLCNKGADPTIQSLTGSIPCEVVPNEIEGSVDWDLDCMFEVLDNYAKDYPAPFASNETFEKMVYNERTPEGGDEQTIGEQAEEAKSILGKLGI